MPLCHSLWPASDCSVMLRGQGLPAPVDQGSRGCTRPPLAFVTDSPRHCPRPRLGGH